MDMQEEETWVPEDFVGQKYHAAATAAAKSLQSCPTLCDPVDGSPPGSPIPGILQAWTLEWVAITPITYIIKFLKCGRCIVVK